jgi:aromatase
MTGYTENRIVVLRDFDHVFDLTNNIELWPQLFTEYKTAKILEKNADSIKFELTTHPEGDRPSRTWTSIRYINKQNRTAHAQRLDPTFPFAYMKIRWEYEKLPSDQAVIMTWMQEFDVHPDCQFTVQQMEAFLNRNTHKQLRAVKENVEKWNINSL